MTTEDSAQAAGWSHFNVADERSAAGVLRRLDLMVNRRLDGLLQGQHLGLLPGSGSEPGESREYRPGDDVRRMDWPVTARTTVPHVRETIADRELETWLLVDLSASLDFGTARWEKRDLAVAAVAAVTYLTVRGGNRVGAVLATGQGVRRIPARGGRVAANALLRDVVRAPRGASGKPTDLAAAFDLLNRPVRRRGLAVVVSDFVSDPSELGDLQRTEMAFERPLRVLRARHDVLAIEVVDPRELELPDVGLLTVVDPETGAVHEVQTARKATRDAFARAAAAYRARVAAALRRSGAAHLQLRTDRDWLVDVVRFVAARRRGLSAGAVR